MWRSFVTTHQRLLVRWLLVFLSCMVCFLYFNQQWIAEGEKLRQQALTALADQLARESYVPISADNLVSLNVLAAQLAEQPFVAAVRIERLDGRVLSRAGETAADGVRAVSAIDDGDQQIVGKVEVIGYHLDGIALWPFVFLMLCLLAVCSVLEVIWRQLIPLSQKVMQWRGALRLTLAELPEVESVDPSPLPEAPLVTYSLHLEALDYVRFQQRLTTGALAAMMRDYDELLQRVADIYGLEVRCQEARMEASLQHAESGEGLFLLCCAASLFRACCEQLNRQRRQQGDACLTFAATAAPHQAPVIMVKDAGLAVLSESLPDELASRLVCHQKDLVDTQLAAEHWQLFVVEGLIARYQKLIAAQATSVLA